MVGQSCEEGYPDQPAVYSQALLPRIPYGHGSGVPAPTTSNGVVNEIGCDVLTEVQLPVHVQRPGPGISGGAPGFGGYSRLSIDLDCRGADCAQRRRDARG
ncbi:hypothetical protein GCM10023080_096270 [Streptomyces pseudoechinosporeus]